MSGPYYEADGVTIWHGDNAEVVPRLGQFDMVFTSPPYNLNCPTKPGGGFDGLHEGTKPGKWHGGDLAAGYIDHGDNMPMPEYEQWQRDVLSMLWDHLTPAGAIFYNHKPRPWLGQIWLPLRLNPDLPVRQIITWARAGGINFSPSHYCPTYEWIIVLAKPDWRLKSKEASGAGDLWRVPQESNTKHPAPFPVALPARAIESAAPRSVLDPFMGSGTTLVAAKAAGVPATGIELSERYCEIAAERLAQGVLFGA